MLVTYVLMFCRVTIALLFIVSFGRKTLALRDFATAIGDFKLLPRRWSRTVALLLLICEITIAILTSFGGNALSIGFLLALALLIVFSTALIITLWRKIDTSCNCFGRSERRISYYDVVRNAFLMLCSLLGLWTSRYTPQSLSIGEIILLTLMSAILLLLITNTREVIETLQHPFPVTAERR